MPSAISPIGADASCSATVSCVTHLADSIGHQSLVPNMQPDNIKRDLICSRIVIAAAVACCRLAPPAVSPCSVLVFFCTHTLPTQWPCDHVPSASWRNAVISFVILNMMCPLIAPESFCLPSHPEVIMTLQAKAASTVGNVKACELFPFMATK